MAFARKTSSRSSPTGSRTASACASRIPRRPTLDPLSTFDWTVTLSLSRNLRIVLMRDITPLHYERIASTADGVVRTSKDYRIQFTDGSNRIHLLLDPPTRCAGV